MKTFSKKIVSQIMENMEFSTIYENWSGIDIVLPLIEKIRHEGAIFILKFDGERVEKDDNGPYTFIVFGKPLGNERIHVDANTLEEGLIHVIGHYAESVWKMKF